MIALNLIRNDIKPLNPEDKVIFAHELMEEYKVQHLPVLENGDYIGMIDYSQFLFTEL